MSGTSMDGIDALLLRVEGSGPDALRWEVVAFGTFPWDAGVLGEMRRAMTPGGADARALSRLHVALGEGFASAFLELLRGAAVAPEEVDAIGSHGQTIWHEPPAAGGRGWTLQLGDPATLAERTGIAVVHDFRARDMAAGGHGAPLVPWADRVLLHRPGVGRALQNLGGMGNVTFLPADGEPDRVRAFDTGPGVALLDAAWMRTRGGDGPEMALPFDMDGRRAARGTVHPALLDALLADPFLDEPPPRSTGRERFGDARMEEILRDHPDLAPDDLLATLVEVTARSVARSYREYLPVAEVDEVVLTGGGARHSTLVRAIGAALAREVGPVPVLTGAEALGIDPDAREAAAFALLAWAHLLRIPGSLPQVTGASGPRVLGSFTPATTPATRRMPGEQRVDTA
ncbi:MAG: anhydro-N-acetylmuramic acid kinase [Gemmatimonadales bacterium]|nr:MAG: anhydro-N-acetylmuramic acid kinase [Gemmatimonadales bacterium]